MTRRSRSIDEAVLRSVDRKNIALKTIHDDVDHSDGMCSEKEISRSLARLRKQGLIVFTQSHGWHRKKRP